MVKIMIDSSADFTAEEKIYDIFIPLNININGNEYCGGVDIDNDEFYKLLTSGKEFPRTSQPSPEIFVKHFEDAKSSGDEIIYFSISSALSGTYQGACIAREMVEYDNIYIIDTCCVSHMIGILVRYAGRRISEGAKAADIVSECEKLKKRIKIFAGVDTLEYLRRGGRLSGASATVGTIANVKPVITVCENGSVETVGKTIGIGRAMQLILDKISEFEIDTDFPVYSLYTCGTENCRKLEEKISDAGYGITERKQVGSVIGAHTGPNVYGVLFVSK